MVTGQPRASPVTLLSCCPDQVYRTFYTANSAGDWVEVEFHEQVKLLAKQKKHE